MTYFKVRCEQIAETDIPVDVSARVRANIGKKWSTDLDGVPELRIDLLRRQHFRCAYCQTHISDNKNGLRELDHVMPKKPTDEVKFEKALSHDIKLRKQTFGYPHFTFEPLNLVITCKQCNTNKGQYDPLMARALIPPATYPNSSGDYIWVHPYFDEYSKNIEITDRRLYVKITDKGDAVILVCKLNKAETLQKSMAAEAYCADRTGFRDMIDGFSATSSPFHREEALDEICRIYPTVPRDRVSEVLDAYRVYKAEVVAEARGKAVAKAEQLCQELIAAFPELAPPGTSS